MTFADLLELTQHARDLTGLPILGAIGYFLWKIDRRVHTIETRLKYTAPVLMVPDNKDN
jgi:hypothetical protein